MLALLLQATPPAAAPPAAAPPAAAPPAVRRPASQTAAPWSPLEVRDAAGALRAVSVAAPAANGAGRLVVRCDRAGTPVVSLQFIPRAAFRGFGSQPVSIQFDGGTPLVDNWELMGAGAIERVDGAVATLTAGLAHARTVTLHTITPDGAAIDARFAGPDSEAALRRVAEACGYTFGQPRPAPAPSPTPTP